MRQTSRLVLPCDPQYTAHREAEKRRQETREWLLQRERASVAPSIVPEAGDRIAALTSIPIHSILRCHRDHHDRVNLVRGAGGASNEPPFCPRFPEKIGRPDFKKST